MPPSDGVAPERTTPITWGDYRLLVESVVDYAIFMLDPAGHVSTWNTGALRMKGYTADEIVGQHFSVFYTPEDRAANKPERVLESVRREGRYEEEGYRVRKDGSRFWASVVITALRDKDGTPLGFAKVTRDLTERRRAEETARELFREQTARAAAEKAEAELRRSEERYRALSQRLEIVLEGVADGITVEDRSGALVFANGAAARISGFENVEELMRARPEDLVARFELLDEAGQPFAPDKLPGRRVLAGERSASAMMQVRERRTGEEHWSAVRSTAVIGSDGTPELAVNIWHDVTAERSQALQNRFLAEVTVALGESLQKDEMLATLCNHLVPGLGDWTAVYLREGESLRGVSVSHVDPEKLALTRDYFFRHEPNASLQGGAWHVVRTGASVVHNQVADELLARATRSPEDVAALRAIGIHAVCIVPIQVRGKVLGTLTIASGPSRRRFDAALVALAEEIGRRAGVALDNAQLYHDAQQAAKVAEEASRAKDEFLATVSHELRTPLSAILGWAKLLKDRVTDPAMTKPLEVIHRNALAQVKIIDDILDVSRVITGKFKLESKPTDLLAVTRDAVDVVRQSALAKRIHIDVAAEDGFFLLEADPERLQQAVWNLLSNAVKFTDAGGRIDVSLRRHGSSILLTVQDTGIGIDPRFLPYVFDRFKQADSSTTRRVSGLGLGLALVRHIVELHGGKVAVASEGLGKGATFSMVLPVRAIAHPPSDPPQHSEGAAPPVQRGVMLPGVRVLIVDDEPDARALVSELLTERGAVLERAGSANEAFEAFRRFRPDVVVSDIGMPDEDGFSLIRRLRALPEAEGSRVPALALTAFARDVDSAKALESGYSAHLGKPVDPDALVATLAGLLQRANTSRT